MKFGFLTANSASGIRPDRLANELEDRGFESIWVPEHADIPCSRTTPYPGGGELPAGYRHMMDPFVSLMAAAASTTKLTLATGICLVLEHDAIDLGCTIATLDVLSGGRVLLGIGCGWNAEELANHRPDVPFKMRYSAMRERVAALRAMWTQEESEYSGKYDRFAKSWIYPKPVRGTVPIALGNAGKVGIAHAAQYADEWCPIDAELRNDDGKPDVKRGIELFRRLASEAGRDPDSIPITLFSWGAPKSKRLDLYRELGVRRIVLTPLSMGLGEAASTMKQLDSLAPVLAQYA